MRMMHCGIVYLYIYHFMVFTLNHALLPKFNLRGSMFDSMFIISVLKQMNWLYSKPAEFEHQSTVLYHCKIRQIKQ